jgi:hypothetical protein
MAMTPPSKNGRNAAKSDISEFCKFCSNHTLPRSIKTTPTAVLRWKPRIQAAQEAGRNTGQRCPRKQPRPSTRETCDKVSDSFIDE